MSCHHSFTLSHTNIIGKYIPEQIAEANQKIEDMQHLGVLVDSISGALYSPSDNALGTVANTLSPAIVYEIGQYFKENKELNKLDNGNRPEEGSAQHILAQTLVAAATASLAGNDALTAGLSAGGAEIIAPKLAEWLYDKDPQDLTSEEKNTISAIISLGSATVGATTGETTDVISSSVAGTTAVEDNKLTLDQARIELANIVKNCATNTTRTDCANIQIVEVASLNPDGASSSYYIKDGDKIFADPLYSGDNPPTVTFKDGFYYINGNITPIDYVTITISLGLISGSTSTNVNNFENFGSIALVYSGGKVDWKTPGFSMTVGHIYANPNDYGMANRGQLTSEFLGGTSLQLGGCVGPCAGTNVSLDGQLQGVVAGESGLGTLGVSGGVGSSVSLGRLGGN